MPSCASKVHGSGRGWPSAIMHNIGFFHDISRTQSFHEIRDFIFRLCSSLAIGIAQSLGFLFASAYTLMRVMSSESESAPCCSSTLSSEHELTESTSGTKGSGLPMRKKRKITSGSGWKFKASWKLPQFITSSTTI